jgi:dihydropteroate synthase
MSNLAIIPARGGSKRIPRKNIKLFLGKPIIYYSIRAAINSELFDEVMVSTDDSEIAKIAIQYGATVPFMRSEKTSNDFATTFDVVEEVINSFRKNETEFEKHTFKSSLLNKILVTLGSRGAKYINKIFPSPDPKETIDVSGAGDTFTAAFTVKYLETRDVDTSITFANEMCSIVVSKRGVSTP